MPENEGSPDKSLDFAENQLRFAFHPGNLRWLAFISVLSPFHFPLLTFWFLLEEE